MKIKRFILLFLSLLVLNTAEAVTPSLLVLKINNHANETLTFAGITGANPCNHFTISTNDILPGGSAIIMGSTTPYYDLIGKIKFKDAAGNTNLLSIVDQRQIHLGQSVFSMHNEHFISFVTEQVFNANETPSSLSYKYVELEIDPLLT